MTQPTLAPPTLAQKHTLLEAARRARQNAHAPYSRFTVGAALLTRSGKIFDGCNVEMAADHGTCAEGVAVANAITQGALGEGQSFIHAIAITMEPISSHDPVTLANTSACGICRQVLHDFAEAEQCWLILDDRKDGIVVRLSELLPFGYRLRRPEIKQTSVDCTALEAQTDLTHIAKTISTNAAAHTRQMPEGAVVVMQDGRKFCGVSVENSNANHYTRALAVACNRSVLNGYKPKSITALALYTKAPAHAALNVALLHEFVCEGATMTIMREGEDPLLLNCLMK